jgi:hypothetical protein
VVSARSFAFATFDTKMSKAFAVGETVASIPTLKGGCHCGAITYELPLPPEIDVDGPGVSSTLKNNIVPPCKQKYPQRGSRPNSNRWRASHCHCGACRQTVWALMIDWVNIPREELKTARNGPTGVYRASNRATREFVSVSLVL